MKRFCLGCMNEKGAEELCPICGYAEGTKAKEAYHIVPGTILKKKYLVGRVLGYGGFGVTYIGFDAVLEKKVAIKEYLPSEFATRMPGQQTLSVFTGEAEEQFNEGLKSFIDEARRLAKFSDVPGIVKIYDTFSENGTSYIVMELLEGKTLSELLKEKGKMSYDEAETIISSVLVSLAEVHKEGIIHRDISPKNIFLTNSGEIKVIDFGSARYASTYHSKSLSVILTQGYAPEEQYRRRGNQGGWSDVYSVAATMYKMLTGVTPQEAIERMSEDKLKEPSKLGVQIDKKKENALMNALNINACDRTQTAEQFLNDLNCDGDVERKKIIQKKKDEGRWPLWLKITAACVPLVLTALGVIVFSGESMGIPTGYVVAPNVIQMSEEEAKSSITSSMLYMVVAGTVPVDYGESGRVQDCSIEGGALIRQYQTINVWLSVNESVFMPNVLYWNEAKALEKIESAGLNAKIEYEENENYADGTVIWQEYPEGEILSKNKLVGIKVTIGSMTLLEETVKVPDLTGLDTEAALAALNEVGLFGVVADEAFSIEVDKGIVLEQSVQRGASVEKGSVVGFTVSAGIEMITVPDLKLKTKQEVISILNSLGLEVEFKYEINNDYEKDLVLNQSEAVGTRLEKGATITVTLSEYDYGTVPSVVGMTEQQAINAIQNAGFKAEVSTTTISSEIAEGLVASQSAVGQYPKGRTILIIKSSGLGALRSVPNVTGKSYADAEATLAAAEFGISVTGEEYSDTVASGGVTSYSPSGMQRRGLTVGVVLSKGRAPQPVPNVVGGSYVSANQALGAIGAAVSTDYQHSETVARGVVIAQSVAPGTPIAQGTGVTITISKGTAGRYITAAEVGAYSADEYILTPEYQYRFQITTRNTTTQVTPTNSVPALDGWSLVSTTPSWGAWSGWKIGDAPAATAEMEVEASTETYVKSTEYHCSSYFQTTGDGRFFYHSQPSWQTGHITNVFKNQLPSSVGPGGCLQPHYSWNKSGETGYYISNGSYNVIYFLDKKVENKATRNIYRTRNMEYTHLYEQFIVGEWSGWGGAEQVPAETASTTVAVEQSVSGYTVVGR